MTTEIKNQILADKEFPRGYYARAVLDGRQRLSGADLKGKARRWSMWYHGQRQRVLAVCAKYGVVEQRGEHGLRYLPQP